MLRANATGIITGYWNREMYKLEGVRIAFDEITIVFDPYTTVELIFSDDVNLPIFPYDGFYPNDNDSIRVILRDNNLVHRYESKEDMTYIEILTYSEESYKEFRVKATFEGNFNRVFNMDTLIVQIPF